ncbi:cupin domain-containing protein [Subtercola sp. YIM 133946]|uniref:cupin domain-containing protein n=1 Tax=Subtercola sp. YIM 133946 TaxID=3118909 RepID=UPI002F94F8FD
MTTTIPVVPSAFLPAEEVLRGELPDQISMEPIIEGVAFATERVLLDDVDGFFAVWECGPGVYPRMKDRRGSFMYILSGAGTITDEDGTVHELTADSVLLLPFGWVGTWNITETIRKVYLHSTPLPPYRDGVQSSVFVDAQTVLHGEWPEIVSMEPIVSGAPTANELTVFDGPDGLCALWACEAGVYPRVKDRRGSFMYIISGAGTITDQSGTVHELTAGSVLGLPYGWVGTWNITETIRKFYVHTFPALGA